jgi:membrane-associated protease RseP (regulator of RpoE activity)
MLSPRCIPRFDLRRVGRRLLHFWIVWTALILVHEAGHAWMARREALDVERITVGVGPEIWRSEADDGRLVLRLVPVAGVTRVSDVTHDASGLRKALAVLSGGALATLVVVLAGIAIVAAWERVLRRRCVWCRIVIADALVLTAFNFLPIPPLDGGRAALAVLSSWRGASFSPDALFWLHLGGLALAIVPMVLWTRWTRRLDAIALRWRAPSDEPAAEISA